MRKIFLICLLFQFAVLSHAQGVKGKVTDTHQVPIAFANVVLLNAKDSTFIAGTVTKEDGSFSLEIGASGNILKVSSIGYVTKLIPLKDNHTEVISLVEDNRTLDEVVVKGSLPQYKSTAGGLNIDIHNSMLKDVGTANDVISMLPGIEGSDGNFKVFAKGTPEIYIDNRKVQNANELKYLKSNEIKSIDIITSPGAKYNAEVSSVIRIKTMKNASHGISLTAYGQGKYNKKWTTYDDASIRYHTGGFEVNGSLYFTNGFYEEDADLTTDIRSNGNEINIFQVAPSHFWMTDIGGRIGASYDINKNNSVGLSYSLDGSIYDGGKANTEQTITKNGTLEGYVDQLMTIHSNENPQHEANLYYLGTVGKLGIDFNGTWVWKKSSRHQLSSESSDELGDRDFHSDNTNRNRMLAAKLILTYPIWKGELSVGSEMSHTNTHGIYNNLEQILSSSNDEIRESNTAVFADYSVPFGNFNIAAGLRYETVKSHYYSFGEFQEGQSRDYKELFPNFSIGWHQGQAGVQLSYEKRISRPGYWALSSNVQYDNRYQYEGGNPLLKPTIKHEVDLVFTYSWLNLRAGYNYSKDVRFSFGDLYQESSEIVIWRQKNFDKQKSFNASLTLSPKFGFYKPTLLLGYWQQIFDAKQYGVSMDLNRPQWEIDFRNWFEIGNTSKAMLHFRYSSGYDEGFTRLKHSFTVNLRLQQDFLKKSLTVSLYANDIFKQQREQWTGYYRVATMTKDSYNYTRSIGLSVSFNFNNTGKSKYKGTGAGNAEKSRL
ncbi:MAG: TonB-dependent receptor domain-containing protein [Prevotella sp.]|jgi:hypothetical protein